MRLPAASMPLLMMMTLLALLLLEPARAASPGNVTCSVCASGCDFASLQAALDGCRPPAPGNASVEVFLELQDSFAECPSFPTDVDAVTLSGPLPGVPSAATIRCKQGLAVDPRVDRGGINFADLTLDLDGSTGPGLFAQPLGNANVSISGCRFVNYAGTPGQALLQQVACDDASTLVFDSNDCTGVQGELIRVLGMHSVFINNNNFSLTGLAAKDLIVVDQNNISQGIVQIENNTQYVFRNCRKPYSLCCLDADCNARCNNGTLEVVDEQATFDKCVNPCTTPDPTGYGCLVYDTKCAVYGPPGCNMVYFANTTLHKPSLAKIPVGNIYYANDQFTLYCVPTDAAQAPNNLTFEGVPTPFFGSPSFDPAIIWTSNEIFFLGTITLGYQVTQTPIVVNNTVVLVNSTTPIAPLTCTCPDDTTEGLVDTAAGDAAAYPCSYLMAPLNFTNATDAALVDQGFGSEFNDTPPLYTFVVQYTVIVNVTTCTFSSSTSTAVSTGSSNSLSTGSFASTTTTVVVTGPDANTTGRQLFFLLWLWFFRLFSSPLFFRFDRAGGARHTLRDDLGKGPTPRRKRPSLLSLP